MASAASLYEQLKKKEASKPGQFTYSAAKPVYSFKQKKPTYTYDDTQLKEYYDKLLNREDFSFDINGNALFNQYKDFYQKQGQLAMMDTIGQASAMTGGYGNSYATSAGQQAYQQNLDQLNQIVPELYQLALQQYQMEGDQLYNAYGVLADDRDFAYNKYLGEMDIWQGDRDFAYTQYRGDMEDYYTNRDFAYGQYRDSVADYYTDRDYLYGKYSDQRGYEYQQERDRVADKQWQQEYNLKVQEFSETVRQFNMEYELSEKEFEEMCRQFALEYDLDVKQFEEDVRQYNSTMAFNEKQFAHDVAQDNINNAIKLGEYASSGNGSGGGSDSLTGDTKAEKFISKLGGVVQNTFSSLGGSNTKSSGTTYIRNGQVISEEEYYNSPSKTYTAAEDFEITAEDEYFLKRFSKIMNEYGVDASDDSAILNHLQDPSLGLTNEQIRKYYYALTA